MEIIVYKARGCLELWDHGECVRRFNVGVGRGTPGHKEREGDLKTPEGEYRVCVKNPKSGYHLSLGLNYPNNADAKRGLESGLISDAENRAICEANGSGRCPPWKTALGGEIYLHGHRHVSGSTRGCVCLDNADVEDLFALVAVGTKVTIHP